MTIVIFGNAPLTTEIDLPVTAPGSRTWQILKTVARATADQDVEIVVFCLDDTPRSHIPADGLMINVAPNAKVTFNPLPYEDFVRLGKEDYTGLPVPNSVRCVIGTGSTQPYATAAGFAEAMNVPLWIDVFGDPICETQSQSEVQGNLTAETAATQMVHVWKLFVDALLRADRFSALSLRQRHALLGQLGCTGRLNQHTVESDFVTTIPYGVFEDDVPRTQRIHTDDVFTVMWCGSFNTWMDVPTFVRGLAQALKAKPNLRLVVVGGSIPGYNEISYQQFLDGMKAEQLEGRISLMNWQSLGAMQKLYEQCDLGLSIDRFTYEAELGSRTRLVNFLAAGVPVASTVVTELSSTLEDAGHLIPFELGDHEGLTEAILTAADTPPDQWNERHSRARAFVFSEFSAERLGGKLSDWVRNPIRTRDFGLQETNDLITHVRAVRSELGD